jgi:hypothetical protein
MFSMVRHEGCSWTIVSSRLGQSATAAAVGRVGGDRPQADGSCTPAALAVATADVPQQTMGSNASER